MTKYLYFILFSLGLSLNIFSQETIIETEFSQNGTLYEKVDDFFNPLAEFKNHEKCIAIDYVGKDKYKIKYKEWEGFVDSQYLVVTEDMMDLFYAYQEKQRMEALKQEDDRRRKIQEIVRKKNELEEGKERQDSIAKEAEDQKKEQKIQEQAIREKQRQDSIAKVKELDKKQQELKELARRNQEYLKEARRKDSIVKVKELEKKQQELKELAQRNQEYLKETRRQDSIAKVKELDEKQQELKELARRNQEYLKETRRQDSIAKVAEDQKKAQKIQEQAIREKQRQDSIAKVKELDKKQQELKELTRKNQGSINAKKYEDSIAKVLEELKTQESESNDLRETCNYSMNEFDDIDNVKIIRTIPYKVNDNLTVELYKQGWREYVFFNLEQDLGCVSYLSNNRSYVRVTLENNQVVTFYHSWDVDCGSFKLKGKLSSSQIAILKKSPIKSLKFRGTKYPFEIDSVKYKEFFIDKLQCLD